jgi:hypothetical protein
MWRRLDFSIRSLQHPLDQLLDLGAGQDKVGELVPTVSGDEHRLGSSINNDLARDGRRRRTRRML